MKYDYFGVLEAMATALEEGAGCLSRSPGVSCVQDCLKRALETDRRVCELETALGAAFLPPVDRGDVIVLAHTLREAVWCVYDTAYLLSRGGETAALPSALPLAQAKAIRVMVESLRHPENAVFHPAGEQFYRTCYLARHHRTDRAGDRALAHLCDVLGGCYARAVETVMRCL